MCIYVNRETMYRYIYLYLERERVCICIRMYICIIYTYILYNIPVASLCKMVFHLCTMVCVDFQIRAMKSHHSHLQHEVPNETMEDLAIRCSFKPCPLDMYPPFVAEYLHFACFNAWNVNGFNFSCRG